MYRYDCAKFTKFAQARKMYLKFAPNSVIIIFVTDKVRLYKRTFILPPPSAGKVCGKLIRKDGVIYG